MTTLSSRCAVQCVEAIKLSLVFLKQFEMYHRPVALSNIHMGENSRQYGLLFLKICFEHIAYLEQQLEGRRSN